MVVLHPGSGKKVSFLPRKVRESQGISFLTTRMNPVRNSHLQSGQNHPLASLGPVKFFWWWMHLV